MKYENISFNTKRMFADSLKRAIEKKPLSKITVSQLITDCGVNRKTFYYHFDDIYDLLKWMLEQEAIEVVKQMDLIFNYKEAVLFVMDYIDNNDDMLKNICHSLGRDELKRFFYTDFIDIMRSTIDKTEAMEKVILPPDFKDFLCQFYTEAIAGILLEYIVEPTKYDRDTTIRYFSVIIRTSVSSLLKKFADAPLVPEASYPQQEKTYP